MTRFFVVMAAMFLFVACGNNPDANEANHDTHENHDHEGHDHDHHDHAEDEGDGVHYGLVEITADEAVSADEVVAKLDAKEGLEEIALDEETKVEGVASAKVEGEITEVCQQAGCWFRMKTAEGKELFIKMKEHKSIPKDWSGKTVVAQGNAFIQETSVDELRHYAEDEGASEEEIAKITEPMVEYKLVAEGVVLKK
jgi:hypothetical protein